MREIKFRAWIKSLKKWYGEDIRWFPLKALSNEDNCAEDIEFMQFTGLKDKNGKEIYEGDLLIHDGNRDCRFEVFYNPDIASFSICRHHYSNSQCGGFTPAINSPRLEVIGNIYENPELLK